MIRRTVCGNLPIVIDSTMNYCVRVMGLPGAKVIFGGRDRAKLRRTLRYVRGGFRFCEGGIVGCSFRCESGVRIYSCLDLLWVVASERLFEGLVLSV